MTLLFGPKNYSGPGSDLPGSPGPNQVTKVVFCSMVIDNKFSVALCFCKWLEDSNSRPTTGLTGIQKCQVKLDNLGVWSLSGPVTPGRSGPGFPGENILRLW